MEVDNEVPVRLKSLFVFFVLVLLLVFLCCFFFSPMLYWTFVEHFGTTLAHFRLFGIGHCYAGRGQTKNSQRNSRNGLHPYVTRYA